MRLKKRDRLVTLCIVVILLIGALQVVSAAPGDIVRVSVHTDGTQATGDSYEVAVSANGLLVAFRSEASNLVDGDTNDRDDIFVHDRVTGTTTRVSVATDGTQNDGASFHPSISDDGRYVAFSSGSTVLAPNANGRSQVYVHDRQEPATTTLVSVNADGDPADNDVNNPSISGCGNYVVFSSDSANLVEEDTGFKQHIYVRDLVIGTTERITIGINNEVANGNSYYPVITPGGRYISFTSYASNLVEGDNNGKGDVFVYDRQEEMTYLVSVSSDGVQGNRESDHSSISADGRYVAFRSSANNLVDDDTDLQHDIFVHDRVTNKTVRASVGTNGIQGNSSNYWSSDISADGRFVVFSSSSNNFSPVKDDNNIFDVFIHNLQTRQTMLVTITADGIKGNFDSQYPRISADGTHVAFYSYANNLVLNDTNNKYDVFVKELDEFPEQFYIFLPLMIK